MSFRKDKRNRGPMNLSVKFGIIGDQGIRLVVMAIAHSIFCIDSIFYYQSKVENQNQIFLLSEDVVL